MHDNDDDVEIPKQHRTPPPVLFSNLSKVIKYTKLYQMTE